MSCLGLLSLVVYGLYLLFSCGCCLIVLFFCDDVWWFDIVGDLLCGLLALRGLFKF